MKTAITQYENMEIIETLKITASLMSILLTLNIESYAYAIATIAGVGFAIYRTFIIYKSIIKSLKNTANSINSNLNEITKVSKEAEKQLKALKKELDRDSTSTKSR